MKTATLPSLRVEPALREAAEAVLQEGETLSSFVETAVRTQVRNRQLQSEFIQRGLASLEETQRTGVTYSVDASLAELDAILTKHKHNAKARA